MMTKQIPQSHVKIYVELYFLLLFMESCWYTFDTIPYSDWVLTLHTKFYFNSSFHFSIPSCKQSLKRVRRNDGADFYHRPKRSVEIHVPVTENLSKWLTNVGQVS